MTLIVGYIHSDSSLHIVVDSAETFLKHKKESNIEQNSYNSFGEIIQLEDDCIVKESAQKIYNLAENILFTFAGEVYEGMQILRDLRYELNSTKDLKVSEIISNYFDFRKPTLSEYIIGFYENNNPKLYYYQKTGNFLNDENSYIILGSGSEDEDINQPLQSFLISLKEITTTKEDVLVCIISILQCCSINILSFARGVGGFYNGACIYKNEIFWANDTCNILYSSKHFEKGEKFIVNKFNRDNVTLVTSPKINKSTFFSDDEGCLLTVQEWQDKWVKILLKLNTDCELDYYVFICFDRRIVTIANRHNSRFSDYIKIIGNNTENVMKFSFSDEMIKILLTYAIDPEAGVESIDGYGIQFNYI